MSAASAKIIKPAGEEPDELELSISQVRRFEIMLVLSSYPNIYYLIFQALAELEENSDMKAQLRELNITTAKVNTF